MRAQRGATIVIFGPLGPDRQALLALAGRHGEPIAVDTLAAGATVGVDPGESARADLLRRARDAVRRIKGLYYEARIEDAVAEARTRLSELGERLAYGGAFAELGDLDLWLAIGLAKSSTGGAPPPAATADERRRAVRRALDLGRRLPEPGILPPEVMRLLENAQQDAGQRPQQLLRVQTSPLGAQVIVDGRRRGRAPVEVRLPSGEHYVAVERFGWQPAIRKVTVDPAPPGSRGPLTLDLALEPAGRSTLASQIARLRQSSGLPASAPEGQQAPDEPELVAALGRLHQAGQVITVRRQAGGGREIVRLTRWLPEWQPAAQAETALDGDPGRRARALRALEPALFAATAGTPDGPSVAAGADRAPTPPVWKRWWFWTVAGVVVAGAAAGAAVGATRHTEQYRLAPPPAP